MRIFRVAVSFVAFLAITAGLIMIFYSPAQALPTCRQEWETMSEFVDRCLGYNPPLPWFCFGDPSYPCCYEEEQPQLEQCCFGVFPCSK